LPFTVFIFILQEFGVDVQQSALLSVLPWFVTILVSNSSGWIADGLANSGRLSMTNTRKLLQTIGSVGPALALLYLATAHNNPGELEMGEAVGALTATLALGGFQSAGKRCFSAGLAHSVGFITACENGASYALLATYVKACWCNKVARHQTPCTGAMLASQITCIGLDVNSRCLDFYHGCCCCCCCLPACLPACRLCCQSSGHQQ
jgi:hypothetical protein